MIYPSNRDSNGIKRITNLAKGLGCIRLFVSLHNRTSSFRKKEYVVTIKVIVNYLMPSRFCFSRDYYIGEYPMHLL